MPRVKSHHLRHCLQLFTCRQAGLFGKRVENLFLNAHGGYMTKDNSFEPKETFTVPNDVTLYFYSPHRTMLTMKQPRYVVEGQAEPLEFFTGGQEVIDYRLTPLDRAEQRGSDSFFKGVLRYHRRVVNKKAKKNPMWLTDILVPRANISLQMLLLELKWQGHFYPRVHCMFCRSAMNCTDLPETCYEATQMPEHTYVSDLGRWRIITDDDLL